MQIGRIGHEAFVRAEARLDAAAGKVVRPDAEVGDGVALRAAEQDARVALKLMKLGDELHGSLLDVLA